MRRLRRLAAVMVAALTIVSGSWSAGGIRASGAAVPGVTANSILVGTSLPESGPAGAYGVIANGEDAYFKYVNAHGGVYGRKLTLKTYDDGYVPARTAANVRRLVSVDNVFALLGVLGTANNLVSLPFITQQRVPLVYPATGSSLMAHPFHKYLFALQVSYTVEGKVMTDYAVRTLHARKLGVFYQNDDFGKEGLDAVTAQARRDGVSVVDRESYEVTDTDVSRQALSLKSAGADAVIIFAIPSPAILFLGTAAKVGLRAAMLSSSIASDPVVLKVLGPAGEGVYFTGYTPLPTDNSKQAVFYRSVLARYGDPVTAPVGSFTLAGVGAAEVFVEGLRRAGRNLTREGFVKGLETLRHYNGAAFPNITYTSTDHAGAQGAYMLRAHNLTLVPVSGYEYP